MEIIKAGLFKDSFIKQYLTRINEKAKKVEKLIKDFRDLLNENRELISNLTGKDKKFVVNAKNLVNSVDRKIKTIRDGLKKGQITKTLNVATEVINLRKLFNGGNGWSTKLNAASLIYKDLDINFTTRISDQKRLKSAATKVEAGLL